MGKRGQVTLFIILGIALVIIAIVLFVVFRGQERIGVGIGEVIEDTEANNVNEFIKNCLKKSGEEALFYFGYEGGRTNFFPTSFSYGSYSVPYYFDEGVSFMPDESEVTNDILGKYVEDTLLGCINGFRDFEGILVNYASNPVSSVLVAKESVVFNLEFPVSVVRGETVIELGPSFRFEQNVRLKEILSITKTIIKNQLKNELFIHWDYITDRTEEDFSITAYTESDNTIVYRIIDERNMLFEQPYLFQFANRYFISEG